MQTDKESAIYLYCLARTGLVSEIEGKGLGGADLFIYGHNDIAGIASRVSLEEFCGPKAEELKQELSWIGPRVLLHEKVIEKIMHYSPVLPAQFGAVFSSARALEDFMEQNHETIGNFLDRTAGKQEWSVKAFLDRKLAQKSLVDPGSENREEAPSVSPGKQYFQKKQIMAGEEKKLKSRLKKISDDVWSNLKDCAFDFSERKVLGREISGMDSDMILNWAFLVDKDRHAEFCSRVSQAKIQNEPVGLTFEYSGPWPPYSFCPSLEAKK